jgi:hypothetical protein
MHGDLTGTEQPNPFADPIGYHQWFEDNKCPCCDGNGERLYNTRYGEPIMHECQCCGGSGLMDADYECYGFCGDTEF